MCTDVEDSDTLAQLDLIHFTLVFATIGTVCAILIGRVLIKLNYENLQKEADFRFSLVRLRENAESIGMLMHMCHLVLNFRYGVDLTNV